MWVQKINNTKLDVMVVQLVERWSHNPVTRVSFSVGPLDKIAFSELFIALSVQARM